MLPGMLVEYPIKGATMVTVIGGVMTANGIALPNVPTAMWAAAAPAVYVVGMVVESRDRIAGVAL